MTIFSRFFRRAIEKTAAIYYEGPEPPLRLGDYVEEFARRNPYATRGEWINFTKQQCAESYRSGWMRGYEYVERDEDEEIKKADPESIADALDPDWRWSDPVVLATGREEVVQSEYDHDAEIARQVAEIQRDDG
jgi:hypothetical protein